MNSQFDDLSQRAGTFLASAQILVSFGLAPLTRSRVLALQQYVFECEQTESQLRSSLEELGDLGLVTSSPSDDILTLSQTQRNRQSQVGTETLSALTLTQLVEALTWIGDLEALYILERKEFERGDTQTALEIALASVGWIRAHPVPALPIVASRELNNAGVGLARLGRFEDSLEYFEEAIASFAASTDIQVNRNVALAMFGKGYVLAKLDRPDAASVAFDAVRTRFGDAESPGVRESVAKALSARANILFDAGLSVEAFNIFQTIEQRFGDDRNEVTRHAVAISLLHQAYALEREGRWVDQISCYRRLDQRFGQDTAQNIRALVIDGLAELARTLARLGRHDESQSQFGAAYQRYWSYAAPAMRAALAAGRTAQVSQPEALRAVVDTLNAYSLGDIDAGWMATHVTPPEIVNVATAELQRIGPGEFRNMPSRDFGWQALVAAPGWWLIRLIPRSQFWGYGLYCLWHHGRVMALKDAGDELRSLAREGLVHIDTPADAWEWYRLSGVCELVGGLPKYTLIEAPPGHGPTGDVQPHEQGWRITCCRQVGKRCQRVTAIMGIDGWLLHEAINDDTDALVQPPEPMLMTPAELSELVASQHHHVLSSATPEEVVELGQTDWHRWMMFAKVVTFPIAVAIVLAVFLWRLTRSLAVLPLLPGLLISRYLPSALDVRAASIHRLLAFLEDRTWRRVGVVALWYAAMTLACAHTYWPWSLIAVAAIAIAYAHTTWVFVRNEATRMRVFRHVEKGAQYLSQLQDFRAEYVLCVALFLLALPLLLSRLSEYLLPIFPSLPNSVGQSYRFTLRALLLQIPEMVRMVVPVLSRLTEPQNQTEEVLQAAIQYVFKGSAVTLLLNKIWAAKGMREEAHARLHRSLREAVALGGRAANTLLGVIASGSDTGKVRMAVLAVGLVGEARHLARLHTLTAAGACSSAAAELNIAFALLGDPAQPIGAQPLVLSPSEHGGDEPLNLTLLVEALRSDESVPTASSSLRRMLSWQGVSVRLRHGAMIALLRIPGAFSARDAIDWTKEFVGASIITDKQLDILDRFGNASLSLPIPDLACAIVDEWMTAPASSLIALARYQSTSMHYAMNAYGAVGYDAALFIAFLHALELHLKRRKLSAWQPVDLVLWKLQRWQVMARSACFGLVFEATRKRYSQPN